MSCLKQKETNFDIMKKYNRGKNMKLTKKELQDYLTELDQISLKKKQFHKYYILAKNFLEDFNNFSKLLNELPDCYSFNIIKQNSKVFKDVK